MSVANIVGYSKCSSSATERMKNIMETGQRTGSMLGGLAANNSMTGWIVNSILGGGGEPSTPDKNSTRHDIVRPRG